MKPLVIAAGSLLALFALGIASRRADDTPEGCVRAYLDAINAKDISRAQDLLVGRRTPLSQGEQNLRVRYELRSVKTIGEGDEVVLATEIGLSGDSSAVMDDLFHLRKVDGHWKIVPVKLANLETIPPSLLAALLVRGSAAEAPRPDNQTQCLSNVKQLGLANLMYANDYDDFMPPSDYWKSDITPYVKKEAIFHCPEDKRPKAVSYRMSDFLSKLETIRVADPAGTVLIYEGEGGFLMARHENKGSVAYMDAHAKLVDKETFMKGYHKANDR
jgi:hypothetical protein